MPRGTQAPVVVKAAPVDNTELVKGFLLEGGRVMHFRPDHRDGRVTRGLTLAYKQKSGRLEIATAVQHRSDVFCKKLGTKTALGHFLEGKTVAMPYRGDVPAPVLLRSFAGML